MPNVYAYMHEERGQTPATNPLLSPPSKPRRSEREMESPLLSSFYFFLFSFAGGVVMCVCYTHRKKKGERDEGEQQPIILKSRKVILPERNLTVTPL